MRVPRLLAALFLLGALSCTCAPEAVDPGERPPGSLLGPCREDGSCDEGLVCEEARCLKPGADGGVLDGAVPDGPSKAGPEDGGRGDASDAGDESDGPMPDGPTPDGPAPDGSVLDGGASDAAPSDGPRPDGPAPDGAVSDAGPGPCETNADCAPSERCTLVPIGGELVPACQLPTGAGAPGEACNAHEDCSSSLCLDGFCSALCASRDDCGPLQACRTETVEKGGTSGAFDVCVTLQDLVCTSNEFCADDGRVCGELRFEEEPVQAYCTFPVEGGDPFGAPCEGATTLNTTCEDRLCLRGRCTRMCEDDSDCADALQGFVCSDVILSGASLRMCLDACAKDGDCVLESHICLLQQDATDDELHWVCREPSRPDAPGATCYPDNQCASGACIRVRDQDNEVVDSYCTTPCEVAADCPAELPVCEEIPFARPTSFDPQPLRVCKKE